MTHGSPGYVGVVALVDCLHCSEPTGQVHRCALLPYGARKVARAAAQVQATGVPANFHVPACCTSCACDDQAGYPGQHLVYVTVSVATE